MIVQVWLTVLLIAALIIGAAWALIGRRFAQRWQMETRLEEEARRQAEEERANREKAVQELQKDCFAPYTKEAEPQPQVQETKNQ